MVWWKSKPQSTYCILLPWSLKPLKLAQTWMQATYAGQFIFNYTVRSQFSLPMIHSSIVLCFFNTCKIMNSNNKGGHKHSESVIVTILIGSMCAHRSWRVDNSDHVWFTKVCLFLKTINWSSYECRAKTCHRSRIAYIMASIRENNMLFSFYSFSTTTSTLLYGYILENLTLKEFFFPVHWSLRAKLLSLSLWVRVNLPWCDRQEVQ